jgi:hypothetical protein
MSGSAKYADIGLFGVAIAAVEAARAIQAAQEEAERRRAVELERQRQFYAYQQGLVAYSEQVSQLFDQGRSAFTPAEELAAERQLAVGLETVRNSSDRGAVARAEMDLRALERDLRDRLARQKYEQQMAQTAEARQRLQAEIGGFDARLAALRDSGAGELDSAGRKAALDAVNACRAMLDNNDVARREALHAVARAALDQHVAAVHGLQAQQVAERQAAEARLAEANQQIAGLRADPAAMRWAATQIEELATRVAGWRSALERGDTAQAGEGALEELHTASADLLRRVNAAQIKADQRDYIAKSMREVLEEMGFIVTEAVAEHPEHPATAVTFSAVNAVGQGISVSVPVDGQIWYDIAGFPLSTESKVGGGTAAVCDSAQRVLEEMHSVLEANFGVRAGELMWEGKDPDRNLRQMDELPRSTDAPDREGRR